jgi:hypothetical protein
LLTVSNHDGVDEQSQEGGLVSSSVVGQQCRGVVVADRCVGRAVGYCRASGREGGNNGVRETHIGTIVGLGL